MRISGAHLGHGGVGRNQNKTSEARLERRLRSNEATWQIVLTCQSLANGCVWFCGTLKDSQMKYFGLGSSKWIKTVIRHFWTVAFENMRWSQLALGDTAEVMTVSLGVVSCHWFERHRFGYKWILGVFLPIWLFQNQFFCNTGKSETSVMISLDCRNNSATRVTLLQLKLGVSLSIVGRKPD